MLRNLPTVRDFKLASQEPAHSAPPPPPQLLLVDDETLMIDSLLRLLGQRGFDMVTAPDGSQAIAQLKSRPFDLVILDLRLPDMSGHAVMQFINEQRLDTDVIITSGDSGIDAAISALKLGAYDYLRKPYSREELLKAVSNALKQRELLTQNQQITQRLEGSERIYRYLVNSSPDIIFTLDQDGLVTFVNERVQPLLGFTREDLLGRHYSALIHAPDLERANYVFGGEQPHKRWSRQAELRLRCNDTQAEFRVFSVELMSVSLGDQATTAGAVPRWALIAWHVTSRPANAPMNCWRIRPITMY